MALFHFPSFPQSAYLLSREAVDAVVCGLGLHVHVGVIQHAVVLLGHVVVQAGGFEGRGVLSEGHVVQVGGGDGTLLLLNGGLGEGLLRFGGGCEEMEIKTCNHSIKTGI